jgi:hypothetical protein
MPVGIEAACGRRGAGAASGGAEWSRVTRSRGGRFARLGFVPGQGFDGTAPWIRKRRMWEGRGGGLRRQESPEPAGIDRQRRLRQGLVWVGRDGRGHELGKENTDVNFFIFVEDKNGDGSTSFVGTWKTLTLHWGLRIVLLTLISSSTLPPFLHHIFYLHV